jgi:NADH-quinone oxidoreductase subunit G
VDSEVSGNMIDLCPVGALTSKPFRYTARAWELSRRKSVSAHDSLGSPLVVQTKQDRVMRVLPLEDETLNECWISDRDRFAYEGLNAEDRITRPMVKRGTGWAEVDWSEALDIAAKGLKDVVVKHGGDALGTLLAPQPHGRGAPPRAGALPRPGFRQRRSPRAPGAFPKTQGAPWLGMAVADFAKLEAVLLVGSTIRKEQPLLATRLRTATKKGLARACCTWPTTRC